jgi:hypothetical protein
MKSSNLYYGNLAYAIEQPCAERILVLPVSRPKPRRLCWERVLLPFVLLGCVWAHQGNVALERQYGSTGSEFAARR